MNMRFCTLSKLFLIMFFLNLSLPANSITTVKIATGEYVPWISEKMQHYGFVSHIISEAFARAGKKGDYAVVFEFLPWKRAFDLTKKGEYPATSAWFYTEERAKHFLYSDSVMTEKAVFFFLKENPLKSWNTLTDLSDRTIGATSGYSYTDEFWSLGKAGKIKIQTASSDEKNIKKLLAKRIDLFPIGLVTGKRLLMTKFDKSAHLITYLEGKPLIEAKGHLLFSKKYPASEKLLSDFNQGLSKLSEELADKNDLLNPKDPLPKNRKKIEQWYINLLNGGYINKNE
ncbi:substrate-binding periplasmic protein [Zooshikella ganghwensis]|uniref:substrate-binding periplasmic protein n=1 Tax=Zooshikella ganghwensis TaxID=202772 RepID=UPI00068507A5|nr:transporter substrate-binding domain-containing protein [Zooshikella ganghwensis]